MTDYYTEHTIDVEPNRDDARGGYSWFLYYQDDLVNEGLAADEDAAYAAAEKAAARLPL